MSTSTQINGNQKKRTRKTGRIEADYISDLPDSVISHILSCLPMKDAVRTSVLSKDWEYKWTYRCSVELDDGRTWNCSESNTAFFAELPKRRANFAHFVDKTLLLSENLKSFRLSCHMEYDLIRMKTWISTALSRNVHNLDIYYHNGGLALPDNLLNCYSLRKLALFIIPSTLKVPAKICFPYLTLLNLTGVEILNELLNSDVVKLNFPVLGTCILIRCRWLNVKSVQIDAPKMTYFASMTSFDAGVSDHSFNFTGGSLLKYKTYGGLPENIVLSGGSDVVRADLLGCCRGEDFNILESGGIQIRKLMNGFLSLEELALSHHVAKAIALAKPRLSFPTYYKLERLVMHCFTNTEVLLELLHAAPFLKFILLYEMTAWKDYDYDAEESVPSCIVSHLEEIKFYGSTGKTKLAKFILKNAIKLKSMHVGTTEIAEKLMKYPRASTCLTIVGC